MSIKVSPERMQQIEKIEYGLNGDIGGLPRTTYYTPDGRVIRAIPSIREYVVKDKDGKVSGKGIRDANLDRGWLLSPPSVRKLPCRWCDRWHDTPEEVDACHHQQSTLVDGEAVKAKQKEVNEVVALKNEVAELRAMLSKFMEAKGNVRQVFQPETNEPTQVPGEARG